MSTYDGDPREVAAVAALTAALAAHGWTESKNLELVYRWGSGDPDRMAANAREVAALGPDLLVVKGASLPAAREATITIPIVFVLLMQLRKGTSLALPNRAELSLASIALSLPS